MRTRRERGDITLTAQMGRLFPWSAMVLLAQAFGGTSPAQAGEALKKTEPLRLSRTVEGTEAALIFSEPQNHIILTVRGAEKQSAPTMAQRVEMWRPLLQEFFSRREKAGRFLLSVGDYPELRGRIAVAAVKSGRWDLSTGRPRRGAPEAALRELLGDGAPFAEVRQLFEGLGFAVSVHSVEKAAVCPWRELPEEVRARAGARPQALVPCGGTILFQLEPKQKR